MGQAQTGSCPVCGAPIYCESPWWGVTPPPPIYTCGCNPSGNRYETATSITIIGPEKYVGEMPKLEEVPIDYYSITKNSFKEYMKEYCEAKCTNDLCWGCCLHLFKEWLEEKK